jgi:signal transduction histidine kinase
MRSSSFRWLTIITVGLVICFVGSTVFIEHKMARVEDQVTSIVGNASPSITEIAAARTGMRRLELGVGRYLGAHIEGWSFKREQLATWRKDIDRHIAAYEALPFFPGERLVYDDLIRERQALYDAIDQALTHVDAGDLHAARETIFGDVRIASETVDVLMERLILLNARHAKEQANQIHRIRDQSALFAYALDGITVVLGIVLLTLAIRSAHLYQLALEERNRVIEERAGELDRFAARVAHDLRGSLAAILISAELGENHPDAARSAFARVRRSAQLTVSMVDALLAFARAGAHPQPGAVAAVAPVLEEVVAEVTPSAIAVGAAVIVEPLPEQCSVACSPGTLASVLSNLLQNAVKYIGEGMNRERRITIRVSDCSERVRLDVEDTGPGIPPGAEATIFELYRRGATATKTSGLGLGLATVKRLVEGSGGTVGVKSAPGKGACFSVELPRGPAMSPAPDLAGSPGMAAAAAHRPQ